MPLVLGALMVATPRTVKLPSSSTLNIETCETVPLPSTTAASPARTSMSVGWPENWATTAASCTMRCPYTA